MTTEKIESLNRPSFIELEELSVRVTSKKRYQTQMTQSYKNRLSWHNLTFSRTQRRKEISKCLFMKEAACWIHNARVKAERGGLVQISSSQVWYEDPGAGWGESESHLFSKHILGEAEFSSHSSTKQHSKTVWMQKQVFQGSPIRSDAWEINYIVEI